MFIKTIQRLDMLAGQHRLYFYATVVLAAAILVLSLVPGFGGGLNAGISAHCSAYFVFSATVGLLFNSRSRQHPFFKAALLAGLYGALIECLQFFVPYRCFDLMDIAVNVSVAFLAMLPLTVMTNKGCLCRHRAKAPGR